MNLTTHARTAGQNWHRIPARTRAHIRLSLLDLTAGPIVIAIAVYAYFWHHQYAGWEVAVLVGLFLFSAFRDDWHVVERDYDRKELTRLRSAMIGNYGKDVRIGSGLPDGQDDDL